MARNRYLMPILVGLVIWIGSILIANVFKDIKICFLLWCLYPFAWIGNILQSAGLILAVGVTVILILMQKNKRRRRH